MTSDKQITANRNNAAKSTGPRSITGKLRSRQNAFSHGLTAETVIDVLERREQYEAFETRLIADYRPQTTLERELVCRLGSLLWRLRRATAVETALLQSQDNIISKSNLAHSRESQNGLHELHRGVCRSQESVHGLPNGTINGGRQENGQPVQRMLLAECFLRLAYLDDEIFERIGRYERALWRQAVQAMLLLRDLKG